jgi:hypothetical protein
MNKATSNSNGLFSRRLATKPESHADPMDREADAASIDEGMDQLAT